MLLLEYFYNYIKDRSITFPTTTPSAFARKSINSSNSNPAIVRTLPNSSEDILYRLILLTNLERRALLPLFMILFIIRQRVF
jgi:hypothetical protein